MPTLIDTLALEGALVTITFGLSGPDAQALRIQLRPVPPPVTAQALIDTGAEATSIDSTLLISLTLLHPSGRASDDLKVPNLRVLELSLRPLGYQALIGRDLLAQCRFLYDGPANRFELSY